MLNFCKRFITFSVCFFFAHAAFSAGVVECKINKAIVRSNQTVLQDLGIYNSNIDGLAGPSYRNAVDKAEKILGKRADGAKRCLNPAERQVLISVFDAKKRGAQCGKLYSPLEIETLYHTLKKGKLTKRRLSDFENVGALIWSIDEASRLETQLAGEKYYETQQNSARDCRLDKAEIESLLGASVITEVAGFENTEGQKRENSTPTILNTSTQTELIVDHSKNYSFDPYDCAFQLNIRSKVKTEQVIFYYQPERKKYVAGVSLALSSFRKLRPSELTFSSLEGSYCSPTAAVDKTFNINGANSIEFLNISLTEIKVEETITSKKKQLETSSTSTKSSLFDILMPEQSQGSIDQSGDEIAKLRRRIMELERQLEGVRSDSLAAKADFQKQLTKAAEVILKVESERDLAQAKLQNLSDRLNAALAKAAAEESRRRKLEDERKRLRKEVSQTLYYEIPGSFTTNLKGSRRFLQIEIGVSTKYDYEILTNVENNLASLRGDILAALSDYTEEMLEGREARKLLVSDLRDVINGRLDELEGFGGIEEVYLTSYVMQ